MGALETESLMHEILNTIQQMTRTCLAAPGKKPNSRTILSSGRSYSRKQSDCLFGKPTSVIIPHNTSKTDTCTERCNVRTPQRTYMNEKTI